MVRNVGTFGKRKDKKTGVVTHTRSETVISGGEQEGDRKTSRFSNRKRVKAEDVIEQPDFVAAPKKTEAQKMDAIIGSGNLSDVDRNRLLREENEKLKPQDELPGEKKKERNIEERNIEEESVAAQILEGLKQTWEILSRDDENLAKIQVPFAIGPIAGGTGGILPKPSIARITRQASAHTTNLTTGKLVPAGTKVTQRAFTGKPANTGVDKLFKIKPKTAALTKQYANNAKSQGVSKSFLMTSIGLSAAASTTALAVLGTYPFSGFIEEEALQTISFPMSKAINTGLYEEAQFLLDSSNELLDAEDTFASKIPIANNVESLGKYFEKQRVANDAWQKIIDSKRI